MRPLRILFLAMNGNFSSPPLCALLENGYRPRGLIIPPPPGMRMGFRRLPYPVGQGQALPLQIAAAHEVPIYEIGDLHHPEALALLEGLDLIITACFPKILPPRWLAAPRLGAINLHPSLLPAYRGPYPLFWQFRAGEQNTGITLHFMDAAPDTGDILAQQRVPFPDGLTGPEADTLTAEAGASLLLQLIADPENIPRTPQPQGGATYQGVPTPEDLHIPANWTARRAFNFIRGAGEWAPFMVADGRAISGALEYCEGDTPSGTPDWIPFANGAVRVVI